MGHPKPASGSPVFPPHLGTDRVPVPRCRGSQRRRMVVARPLLQGCVMSLDLPGDMGGQEDSGGTVWVSPPVTCFHLKKKMMSGRSGWPGGKSSGGDTMLSSTELVVTPVGRQGYLQSHWSVFQSQCPSATRGPQSS